MNVIFLTMSRISEIFQRGIDRTLHLTVPKTATSFVEKIISAQQEGVKVV